MRICFGPFAFDTQSRLLWRDGTEVALPPRVLAVLELLLERPGEVIARQELIDRVWKDAFVSDTSLAEAISFLRQALGDDPQTPRYIQTIHRRGYRFVGQLGTSWGLTPTEPGQPPDGARAESARVSPSIARQLLPWSVAALCAAAAVAAVGQLLRQPAPQSLPVIRFELRPPGGTWFDRRSPALAVSPDGARIAWSGCEGATSICALFVRRVDRLEAARLAGTDGAEAPFFSPDGRWLGFFADGKLKKIAVSGGSPVSLADAPYTCGASWGMDGRIAFCGTPAGGLSLAADQGGEVTPLTTPQHDRGELRHAWPQWLPDGRTILFTIVSSPAPGAPGAIALLRLPSHAWRPLRGAAVRATAVTPGYLLVSTANDLQASTFEENTLTLTGASDSVLDSLATGGGVAQYAFGGGTLVAARAAPAAHTFAWSDAPDKPIPGLARLTQIAVAPDGSRAAGVAPDASSSDIWIVDLRTAASARLTFGGVNVSPVWTADSAHVVFAARGADGIFHLKRDANFRLKAEATDHAREATGHAREATGFPSSVSRDGSIAMLSPTNDGRMTVSILGTDGQRRALDGGPFDELTAVFSPDGRWLAVESDESGRREILVRSVPNPRTIPISTGGGERPAWSGDGRSLYFHQGRRLLRVPFDPASGSTGAAEVVLDRPDASVVAVSADGRLLIERDPLYLDTAVAILQWPREIRQKLPPPVTTPR